MKDLLAVVVQGRAARAESGLKVRQPLSRMIVSGVTLPEAYSALAGDELNVKSVEFTDDTTAFMTYSLKPQMRTLGKKYGKLLRSIGEKLTTLDGNEVVALLESGKALTFELEGTAVELMSEDVLTAPIRKPGYVVSSEKEVTVALDTNLTPELIAEGYAREIVSKVQTMRKESGLEVTDRIRVGVQTDSAALQEAIALYRDNICRGVLATDLTCAALEGEGRDWNINGVQATLFVVRA